MRMLKKNNFIFWVAFVVAVAYFVLSLVFMTDYYSFFYDGTNQTVQFFKELQILNRYIFMQSLIVLVSMILLLPTGLKANNYSLVSIVLLLLSTIYMGIRMTNTLPTITYFIAKYHQLTLSPNLVASSQLTVLELAKLMTIVLLVLLVILTLESIVLWFRTRQRRKQNSEVSYG
ncbi:hypothetical protein [Lapidilactobacillus bayanensis]|uniref:hypothetical protein n=1 Tax=Lapidilactobacillus bayanensis TaxID=2485998 RepID=UPI000F7A24A3|nr:hypothetical protein [Lapidilactobacillus bayanensis]